MDVEGFSGQNLPAGFMEERHKAFEREVVDIILFSKDLFEDLRSKIVHLEMRTLSLRRRDREGLRNGDERRDPQHFGDHADNRPLVPKAPNAMDTDGPVDLPRPDGEPGCITLDWMDATVESGLSCDVGE